MSIGSAIISQTAEGILVVDGVFQFYETHGLPLDMLFTCLREKNLMPCWISFYKAARKAGMKHTRILSKLEEAICDAYDKNFSDTVISKLELIFNQDK